MQKTKKTALAYVLLFTLCFSMLNIQVVQAEDKPVTSASTLTEPLMADNLSISIKEALGGNSKSAYKTGVEITIVNRGENFEGILSISQAAVSYGEGNLVTEQVLLIPAGETKVITMTYAGSQRQPIIELAVKNGRNTILTKEVILSINTTTNGIIGILSDEPRDVNYMSNSFLSLVALDETTVPVSADALDAMDVLVINNFDTSKLNTMQYEAIKEWIKCGGTMVIGTGEHSNKTLALFEDGFIAGSYTQSKNIQTSFGLAKDQINSITTFDDTFIGTYKEFGKIQSLFTGGVLQSEADMLAGNEPVIQQETVQEGDVPSVTKEWIDLMMEDSYICLSEGEDTLIQRSEYGKGAVLIANIDLSLDNTLWNTLGNQITRILISSMANERKVMMLKLYNGEYYSNGAIYALQSGDVSNMPKTSTFGSILCIYLLFCGPILYIILKKYDKREWLWGAIPVTALVFTIIISSAGTGTKFRNSTANYVHTVFMSDSEYAVDQVEMTVMTPSNKGDSILLSDGYKGIHLNGDGYYSDNISSTDKVISNKEGNTISVESATSFGTYSFGASRIRTQEGTYESSLTLDNRKQLSGTFTNHTGYNFSNCAIFSREMLYVLGNVESGEVVDASTAYTDAYGGSIYWNDGIDRLLGVPYQEQNLYERIQFEAIERVIEKYCRYNNESDQFLIGLVKEEEGETFGESISIGSNGTTLVVIPMTIPIEEGEEEEQYIYNINSLLVSSNGSIIRENGEHYLADMQSIVAKYQVPEDAKNPSLVVGSMSNDISYGYEVSRDLYMYNFETKQYDQVGIYDAKEIVLEDAYLNENNQFIVRYESPWGTSRDTYLLPTIALEGGQR